MVQKFDAMPSLDETRPISGDVLMPAIMGSPGFRGVCKVRNERERDRSAVVMLFDEEENARGCHARLMDLMRQHMPKAKAGALVRGETGIMVVASYYGGHQTRAATT